MHDDAIGYYGNCIYCIMLNPNSGYDGEEWDGRYEIVDRSIRLFKKGYQDFISGIQLQGRVFDKVCWDSTSRNTDNYIAQIWLDG